eukprot:scaffold107935_cov28-Tisochrysis_lutea.AAC.3
MGEINALSSRGPGAPLEPESGGVSAAAAREAVSRLVRQIQTIKRNVGEGRRLETAGITKCRARVSALLAHDKTIQLSKSTASRASTDENASPAAASTLAVGDGDAVALASQCDRMIADYLVRTGRSRSVAMLCRSFVASQYASDEPAAATSALTAACTDCAWPAVGWAGTLPHTPTFAEVTKGLALPRGQPSVPTVALASTSTTHATSKVAGLAGDTHVRGDGDTAAIVVADRTLAAAASGPEEGCCAGDGSIACLLDRAPFAACQRISRQLQAGNAVLALEWCESERSRLRKIKCALPLLLFHSRAALQGMRGPASTPLDTNGHLVLPSDPTSSLASICNIFSSSSPRLSAPRQSPTPVLTCSLIPFRRRSQPTRGERRSRS